MSRLRRFYDQLNEENSKPLEVDLSSAAPREPKVRVRAAAVGLLSPDAEETEQMEEAETADVPPNRGYLASDAALDRTARVLLNAANPVVTEHYRRLRTRLLQECELHAFRTLMVASPNPNEGKSVTALNLALSFSMLPSSRILIVDGDLRKGSLGKWLGIERQPGLSELIEGTAELNQVIAKSDKLPIWFMTRGESTTPPAELLNGAAVKKSFDRMARSFDLVVVDSPPLNVVTDAHLLAQSCDAVLLVARAFSTSQKDLEKAAQELQRLRVLGVVLNGGGPLNAYRKYHGYY